MVDAVASAMRALQEVKAALAEAQEALAGARYTRRRTSDQIARNLYRLNEIDRVVTKWRCMTPDEKAELDAVNARTAPTIAHWTPIERSLKQGVREAEIDLKKARSNRGATNGSTGEKPGKDRGSRSPRLYAAPYSKQGPGNRPPGLPREPGTTGDSLFPARGAARSSGAASAPTQLDLFGG